MKTTVLTVIYTLGILLIIPFTALADPTPTCAPCLAEINISSVSVSDDYGDCFDGDDLIDIGEIVGFTVTGSSMDSCCWGPGNRSVSASTSYAHMHYLGFDEVSAAGDFSFKFIFFFEVDSGAECLDTASINIDAYVTDSYVTDEAHRTIDHLIEVDDDGEGGYICDTYPCEGSSPPTPSTTPTPIPALGVDLEINQTNFKTGDPFVLKASLNNPGEMLPDQNLVVLLDVYSQYFWYPGWNSTFDCLLWNLLPGTHTLIILNFTWPETGSGIFSARFSGVLLNSDTTEIVGEMDTVAFGWSN